jgi:hypothetical protein
MATGVLVWIVVAARGVGLGFAAGLDRVEQTPPGAGRVDGMAGLSCGHGHGGVGVAAGLARRPEALGSAVQRRLCSISMFCSGMRVLA